MLKKEKEQIKARKLRSKGYSIKEIAKELNVSQGSVSPWVRSIKLNKEAQNRIKRLRRVALLKTNKIHRQRKINRLAKADKEAVNIIKKKDSNKILLALIYWCEGAKDDSRIDFVNSDPNLIKTFLRLFRKEFVLDESKFRVCVHLHSYHDVDKQLKFWSKTTNIPRQQFMRPYKKANTKRRTREGYEGCASIVYYDARLAQLLLGIAKNYILDGSIV